MTSAETAKPEVGSDLASIFSARRRRTLMDSVLIVDDEPDIRDLMAAWTESIGLTPTMAGNADEALTALGTQDHALAVIDIRMPGQDGLWLARQLERDHPCTAVVLATGYVDLLDDETPEKLPIADLLVKPVARDRFLIAVERGRSWRKKATDDAQWHARLSLELHDRIDAICADVRRQAALGMNEAEALISMTTMRMPAVAEHGERVARFARSVARELSLDDEAIRRLVDAARFHDIGKLALPDALLIKPAPLTAGERGIVRRHVDAGAAILASTVALNDLAALVFATHEWFGGGGYPKKLLGDAIPLASRIVAVVDAYDAMTQERHYRGRIDSAEAIAELLRCARTQFDPTAVTAFLNVLGRQ